MRLMQAIAAALMLLGAGGLGCGLYLPAKAVLAQHLLHRAWERSAAGPVRPWPWARTWPVARLEVPHLGIDRIVLAGAQGAALAFAPGHVDGTAQPGEHGNIVLAGHRDTVFAFLAQVRHGDELVLETHSGRKRRFVVVSTAVVQENDTTALEPTAVDVLTLITCYPLDATRPGGPLRYILRAVEEPNWSSAIPGSAIECGPPLGPPSSSSATLATKIVT